MTDKIPNLRDTRRPHSADARVVKVKTESSGFAALKTLIVMALIFGQIAMLVFFYMELARTFQFYIVFSFVCSMLCCIYSLSSNKNSLSKAVWIIFLIVFFYVGYVIYIMSDDRIFFSRARRKYKRIFDETEKYIPEYREGEISASADVINDGKYLYRAGGFANYKNTALEYYPSGTQLFDNALESCRRAEKFIFMEFFIVSDGVLMNRFYDVLAERAAHGVDIRIICDDMGSHRTLSRKMKKKLRDAGIKLVFFNRLVPIISVALNYRDHRKIMIIDGKCAYSGGSNFADEYINEKRMYGYWKDTGIRLRGEAIDSFTLIFLRQWRYLTGKSEDLTGFFGHFECIDSESLVVPYADGLDYKASIGLNAYENMISSADERLYIMTPYFICNDTLTGLIINKALSGVDVRIILPGVPDKAAVYGVSINNAEKLIEYGVKVYTMDDSFVHSKLVLTENAVIVGSINMDLRSFYQQFECAVYTNDASVMSSVLDDFEMTFKDSTLIDQESKRRRNIFHRMFAGILQLVAPLM